ncbi:hypothetical protein [Chromobacterium piscinae]|uniref:hypothetical protein n=1 Tax=Chromobacterium piscinae TaxID=686831 RepID=UPI0032096691
MLQKVAQATPFAFGEIELSQTVFIEGVPYVTRRAVGEWLEYEDPIRGISKILDRNLHIDAHSVVVKLTTTDGKNYDTSVYHPIGFLLIVMESGQPKAHEMKAAVAEFVWSFAGPRQLGFRERDSLLRQRRQLVLDLTRLRDAFGRAALLADLRQVSLSLGLPLPDVTWLGKDADQLQLPGV